MKTGGKRKPILFLMAVLVLTAFIFIGKILYTDRFEKKTASVQMERWICGITVDDCWYDDVETEAVFPGAKVGFGECGNTTEDATEDSKLRMAHSYYTMEQPSEHYIGGCFWWNWVQDCVPHEGNAVYDVINRWMRENKDNPGM